MRRQLFERNRFARRLASTASSVILVFGLCSCQTAGMSDITGSLGEKTQVAGTTEHRSELEIYGDRFRATRKDADAALKYGKALRAAGQRAQAVAVLEEATVASPGNKALLAGYGRALADNGDFQQAFDVLGNAHTPDDPDWRILSAQGTVLDQLGRYDEARQYYGSALKIAPDEPSVLSNLGMSYLLSKDLAKAAPARGRGYERDKANSRVRMNFAVVLALEGRQSEADTLLKADVPPDEGNARVAELKRLLDKKELKPERSALRTPATAAARAE